ncbi:transporter protein [Salmonella enterica subsp. arizonae]|uniref:Transporter protein n=1 Tax=Salmonella enterica subsp. arizonae TaxID=59203 RepID=A0A379T8Q5_SALER|nr:transporter protein [Salmonella enterica subsp. arizonae]SUG46992.1 transporter protein [Salmonella enterica subsp. arizonae]
MTECPDSRRRQLWSMAFGFFMPSPDTIIVNTALPSMAKLAIGMAVLALNGSKSMGISPQVLAALAAGGAAAILLYLFHAKKSGSLFSLRLFRTPTFSLGLQDRFAGRIGSGMQPFITPVFLQIGLGFYWCRQ